MAIINGQVFQLRDIGGQLLAELVVDSAPNPHSLSTAPVVGTGPLFLRAWFPTVGHYFFVRFTTLADERAAWEAVVAAATSYSGVKWNPNTWTQTAGAITAPERSAIQAALAAKLAELGG